MTIAKDRSSELADLLSVAIKATFHTRRAGGVERCLDMLIHLRSMSLSIKDIHQFSKSIFKLETLRRHRNPRIRMESQSLFLSWLKKLYAQGRDHSLKSSLTEFRLKPKKDETTTCALSVSKSKEDLTKKQETKTNLSVSNKKQEQNIKDKSGQFTTKILIPPPKRVSACINVPAKASGNPNSAAKTEEMVELFEAAKKAADVANAKGFHLGKAEASRCVEAISLLMKIDAIPKPKEPRRMMERLEGLTKHKDRKICNAASALLQLWRQRIREQERKAASAIDMMLYKPRKSHQTICGQGFTGGFTKTTKLVM